MTTAHQQPLADRAGVSRQRSRTCPGMLVADGRAGELRATGDDLTDPRTGRTVGVQPAHRPPRLCAACHGPTVVAGWRCCLRGHLLVVDRVRRTLADTAARGERQAHP